MRFLFVRLVVGIVLMLAALAAGNVVRYGITKEGSLIRIDFATWNGTQYGRR